MKVLGLFGQWKQQWVAEWRKEAWTEVILVKEGVRVGMRVLMKQMQLFNQICRQGDKTEVELSAAAKKMEEWWEQVEGWAGEMDKMATLGPKAGYLFAQVAYTNRTWCFWEGPAFDTLVGFSLCKKT